MRNAISRLECKACKAVIRSDRPLTLASARRFARRHESHGQLYASIVHRSGENVSTTTAHVRSRRPRERPLTPAEKVAGALFADVVDAYERLMEGVEVGGAP